MLILLSKCTKLYRGNSAFRLKIGMYLLLMLKLHTILLRNIMIQYDCYCQYTLFILFYFISLILLSPDPYYSLCLSLFRRTSLQLLRFQGKIFFNLIYSLNFSLYQLISYIDHIHIKSPISKLGLLPILVALLVFVLAGTFNKS